MFLKEWHARKVYTVSKTKALSWSLRSTYATVGSEKPQSPENRNFFKTLNNDWAQAKPYNELPGLTKWQLLRGCMKGGELHNASFIDILKICRQRYGDIFVVPGLFGRPNSVALFNIDDFEKVQRTEGPYPMRPGADAVLHYRKTRKDGFFNEVVGKGTGEDGSRFRHAVNPVLMQPKNTKLYLEPLQKVSHQFVHRIREIRDPHTLEVPGNFFETIHRSIFESVVVVALNKELGLLSGKTNTKEADELFETIQIFFKSFLELGVQPSIYKYVPTPTYKRFKKAMDTMFDISYRYIREAMERIEQEKRQEGANREEKSVLEKLLKVNEKIAVVMAMDMIMAGIDTTATVMAGLLLNIARCPEKQQKLREEVLSVLPCKEDRFTTDNIRNLPYLRACIKESLRVYPVTVGNMRETGADLPLSGYRVPKGTVVFMNSNMLLGEEKYYPRANEFIPERWLRTNDGSGNMEKLVADNLSPFIYSPFGFGPRNCVGKRIVDLEFVVALGTLVRNFNIEFNYSTENPFTFHFIAVPAIPLKFKFTDLN